MITVFAYLTPSFRALADVTLPNIRRYCERHGYRFILHQDADGVGAPRPFGFAKTEAALEALRSLTYGVDFLFVIDLDVLVTNHTVPLESFIDEEHDIFATHDVNGFNSGVYLIRHTLGTVKFMEDVLSRWGQPGVFGEQDAMRDALQQSFGSLLKILPQSEFNSYLYHLYDETKGMDRPEGQWEMGDLILHLPGMDNARRIEIFNSPYIQEAIIE